MDVRVHGKNTQVDDGLREMTEDRVSHAGRIFDKGAIADVEFVEVRNPRVAAARFSVEITSHIAGHTVRVESKGPDDRSALDAAASKFERQLRRLKTRLIQRSRKGENKHLNEVTTPVDEEDDGEGPQIVRVKRFALRPMTPEEAALQMEMIGHSFFFFLNAETGSHNVLYHRQDGSLGLIEPE